MSQSLRSSYNPHVPNHLTTDTLRLIDGRISTPRIAVTGVAEAACRLRVQEEALTGVEPSASAFEDAAAAAAAAADPPESEHISADYRRDLLRSLLPRVLQAAVSRAAT